MSCRHDLANGTCARCYPGGPRAVVDPGPEENYGPNLDGPGALAGHHRRTEILRIERKHGGVAIYETPNGDLEVDTIMDDGAQDVFETFPGDEDAIEVVRELVEEIKRIHAAVAEATRVAESLQSVDRYGEGWRDSARAVRAEIARLVQCGGATDAGINLRRTLDLTDHELEGLRSLVNDLATAWVKDHQKDGLRALARHLDERGG